MQGIHAPSDNVIQVILDESESILRAYKEHTSLVEEHANGERRITQGGYGERQLYELVQNGADEMRDEQHQDGEIRVVLTDTHLYCANQGDPVTPDGARTILSMSVSRKQGSQIGRFGVGVKSVLSVSHTPQFFSTTGAFGFDREWSAARIREAVPAATATPVLRMARELDAEREQHNDAVLRELINVYGATTVVRLPLMPGAAKRLGEDVRNFPSNFQLFSPHVGLVVLEDQRNMPIFRRTLKAAPLGDAVELVEEQTGKKAERHGWRVFSMKHEPSAEVRESAGELHDREHIDVQWAVPAYRTTADSGNLTVPGGRGTFWAFFPTEFETTLSGNLNAAWKTNEDRQALLRGSPLNVELIDVAAGLVIDSLPELVDFRDVAAYLHLLPGRDKESPNWACAELTNAVWRHAASRPSLPDQVGRLREPQRIRITPEGLSSRWLALWAEYPGRPTEWLHHSVDAHRDRRGKVNHILSAAGLYAATVKGWLEALVGDRTPGASRQAITILEDMWSAAQAGSESGRKAFESGRQARIILTEDGELVAPVAGEVYRRSTDDGLSDDLTYVHSEVAGEEAIATKLEHLGVREAHAVGRFAAVLDKGFRTYGPNDWQRFWELSRMAGDAAADLVKSAVKDPSSVLHVRTVDGGTRLMRNCLLPGRVVPQDGSRDGSVTVDLTVHADDLATFRKLGLADVPTAGHDPAGDQWFEDYRKAMHAYYCDTALASTQSRPQLARLWAKGSLPGGPLHLLTKLSTVGRAAFIAHLPDEAVFATWRVGVASNSLQVPSPLVWLIERDGKISTSQGVAGLRACVSPALQDHADVLPVARLSLDKARKLGLPATLDEVPSKVWRRVVAKVLESEDDVFIGRAYALMVGLPEEIFGTIGTRCRIGDSWAFMPDGGIAVAASRGEFDALVREGYPVILAPDVEAANRMIDGWGMNRPADVISQETRHVADGEPMPLVEAFPALRMRFGTNIGTVQFCSELEEVTRTPNGTRTRPLPSARIGDTVLLLRSVDEAAGLEEIDKVLKLGLGAQGCVQLFERYRDTLANQARRQAFRRVAEADTIFEKLLLLIGEDELKAGLPAGLIDAELAANGGSTVSPRRVAELAYNAHGDEVLKQHAKDVSRRFPTEAPTSYGGSTAALRFVADLGLPESFAGTKGSTLEPRLTVEGPREFPRLHAYQERLASNLVALLLQSTPQRAMLSLPTGAGKTRVTAEGVIRWVKEVEELTGPILWIAQTEELCEQAVQSWKFVWEKVGPEQRLVVNRLWSTNEATATTSGAQLVVATDAKLRHCLDQPEYEWLRDAALVIIDEAHTAQSKQYTEILELLGLTHRVTSRHLIGLTATAFRGRSEEETRLLAQRFGFGDRRLDYGVFSSDDVIAAYADLQQLEVLSYVDHAEIDGGKVSLTDAERAAAAQYKVLPRSVEQKLADDQARNQRLVAEIEKLPHDWPVLFFATSVAHAKVMAALLNDRDITSASIDAATATTTRRQRIEDFRAGRIRVLTNYGVLTQGFDAPATRAVVVARPVYSPNVYQQMIGRGLRGPRNGGKSRCLILNVRDNIANFGEDLAFTDFEYLWKDGR